MCNKVRIAGADIIKLRQKLGFLQNQLGALLGISNYTVGHGEIGKTIPSDGYKRKIAALRDMGKRD